jgi:phosphatidylinositol glycan class Q protein
MLHTDRETRLPHIHNAESIPIAAQVIVYGRPQPSRMQYLSLRPIALALDDKIRHPSWDTAFEEEEKERKRKEKLVEKLRLHKVISRPPSQKELALPMLIEQVNCSWELNALLQKNIGVIGRRMKRAASVSERMVDSANSLWDYTQMALTYILWTWMWPVLSQIFVSILMANRVVAEAVLRVLHWRPATSPDAPALKDMSATAQQIDIRLQQFCYWPIQYLTLRKSRASWGSITNSHPDYIRFYNSLWLVANDIILGIALGSFIMDNSELAAAKVDMIFSAWSVGGLRRMIIWLMGWPGGLKLNTELADFLGDLFLWVIDYWAGRSSPYHNLPHANSVRMHKSSPSAPPCSHTGHWLLSICWCHDANFNVSRSSVSTDATHLLFLYCLGTYLSLATYYHDLALPSVSRQEAQCTPKPDRLLRLRS